MKEKRGPSVQKLCVLTIHFTFRPPSFQGWAHIFRYFCPDADSVTICIEAVNVDVTITRETKHGKMVLVWRKFDPTWTDGVGKEVQGAKYPVLLLQLFINKH